MVKVRLDFQLASATCRDPAHSDLVILVSRFADRSSLGAALASTWQAVLLGDDEGRAVRKPAE
jgi:hypothetical protein